MVAYKFQYKDRQSISVFQATADRADAMEQLAGIAYGIAPELTHEWFPADQYRSRIQHFPEGQFIAVDPTTGKVVGCTSSMRFHFNPEVTFLEDWDLTTGYG